MLARVLSSSQSDTCHLKLLWYLRWFCGRYSAGCLLAARDVRFMTLCYVPNAAAAYFTLTLCLGGVLTVCPYELCTPCVPSPPDYKLPA